jgi:hypothetical protein
MAIIVKIKVFWVVTLELDTYPSTFNFLIMMMEAAGFSKISVTIYKSTCHHILTNQSWLSAFLSLVLNGICLFHLAKCL